MIQQRALLAIALLLPLSAQSANCTTSATGPAFGVYNPLNASPTDSNGSVTVSCTLTTFIEAVNYNVSFSSGASGNAASRRMVSGLNPLFYNIYDSTARTQVLGDGTGGSVTISGNMTLFIIFRPTDSETYTMFGRIPAAQNAVPGTYLDTILVTVTY